MSQLQEVPKTSNYRWAAFAAFLLFGIVYLGSLTSPALLDDADASHSEAAREMFARGDYVTLHINGVRYLEKAPLIYWLVAFGFRVFGVGELAVRLPSALAMFLLMLLAYRWSRRAFSERVGIYAALFIAYMVVLTHLASKGAGGGTPPPMAEAVSRGPLSARISTRCWSTACGAPR